MNLFIAFLAIKLHLITVASKDHPRLETLKKSASVNGHDLKVLGFNKYYPSNSIKIKRVLEFIQNLEDDDVVLFVDAYDTLITSSATEILEKFSSFDHRLSSRVKKTAHLNLNGLVYIKKQNLHINT
jgi:hypothetical protein